MDSKSTLNEEFEIKLKEIISKEKRKGNYLATSLSPVRDGILVEDILIEE